MGSSAAGAASGRRWSDTLRFRVASQDERLLRALAQHIPESRFDRVDGAALDGGLPCEVVTEFERWWGSLGL